MNRDIEDLQGWKKLHEALLYLHQIQAYYSNEIKRGFASIREYHIAKAYASLKVHDRLQS